MPSETLPAEGTKWEHYNGCKYNVLMLTNLHSENEKYPVTVVYQGENGRVWSRPLSDWHRSMTEISS